MFELRKHITRRGVTMTIVTLLALYVYLKRRRNLGFRMNVLVALLLDTNEVFPEILPLELEARLRTVRKCRALWERLARDIGRFVPTDEIERTEDLDVPSREAGRSIRVRLYRPKSSSPQEKLPVVINVHGGGWVYGNINVYDRFCRMVCARGRVIICAVDYRLAPEHPFPAGLEDCEDVLMWAWNGPTKLVDDLHGSPKECGLGVCGDSAGGNICAALAVYAKNRGIKLDIQVLLYPAVSAFATRFWRQPSYILPNDSIVVNANAPVITTKGLLNCWELYLSNPEVDVTNPRASPILFSVEELRGVCKAHVITAEADMLKDEGVEYYKLLERADVPVTYKNYEDTIHGFLSLTAANHHESGVTDVARMIQQAFGNNRA